MAERRAVNVFLAYLKELPLHDWLLATQRTTRTAELAAADAVLMGAARRVRETNVIFETENAVVDALHRFEEAEGRRLTRWRHSADELRPATERAALAVLLRRELSDEQFTVLYGRFEALVPAALLFGIQ